MSDFVIRIHTSLIRERRLYPQPMLVMIFPWKGGAQSQSAPEPSAMLFEPATGRKYLETNHCSVTSGGGGSFFFIHHDYSQGRRLHLPSRLERRSVSITSSPYRALRVRFDVLSRIAPPSFPAARAPVHAPIHNPTAEPGCVPNHRCRWGDPHSPSTFVGRAP